MKRLRALLLTLAGMVFLSAAAAVAQEWPARPVRIVCTFAAGGAADILARMVADHLSGVFGQQFFVEMRAGAGGAIGVQSVAHSDPDGYNFVITTLSLLAFGPMTNAKLGFDPQRELTNIAYLAGSPIVFVVNPKLGVKTLSDFVAYAKRSDRPPTYSSSGVGSNGQLVAESFAQMAGIKVEHVPYKGAAQGITDLIGGHIVFSAQTLSSASAFIRAGTLIPLAHSAAEPVPDYPDIPTFKQSGYPAIVSTNWFALSGPAGLPKDMVKQVNREVVNAMSKPETQQRLRQDGLLALPMNPEAFAQFIAEETVRWKPVVERAGLAGK